MLSDKKIAFIGSGVMAEAMITGLLRKEVTSAKNIIASGPRLERGEYLSKEYGVHTSTDNRSALRDADIVVMSVKPQMLAQVMSELNGGLPKDSLVLSIVAGAKIDTIERGLGHKPIARSMPNTPAQIGEGITVWTASDAVNEEQRGYARAILTAFGEEIYVEDEDYLDMATALSGTGPSYVFLFMEAMIDAGVHLGFPRYIAEELVLRTVSGAVAYVQQSPHHLSRLRNQVTSPGGTSAEALYYLERAGFRTALSRAIWAAYQRSLTLGEGRKKKRLGEGEE